MDSYPPDALDPAEGPSAGPYIELVSIHWGHHAIFQRSAREQRAMNSQGKHAGDAQREAAVARRERQVWT